MPSATINISAASTASVDDFVGFIDWVTTEAAIGAHNSTSITITGLYDGVPAQAIISGIGFTYQTFGGIIILTGGTIQKVDATVDGVYQGNIVTSINAAQLLPIIQADESGADPSAIETFMLGFDWTYNGGAVGDNAPQGTLIGDGVPFESPRQRHAEPSRRRRCDV